MKVRKEITELLNAGIITPEIAERINDYYDKKSGPSQNKIVIVFGILGALLVGLGIILILASNWDDLPRTIKTVIAFVPLLIGQFCCGYTLIKKEESVAWREASSTFLIIAIGATISLISQIYNIPGRFDTFLLTWIMLSFPIIYIMRSSCASLMYIILITWYGCISYIDDTESYLYWGLLLLALLYYILFKQERGGNFFTFHNWFIPLSAIIVLGTVARDAEPLMLIAYVSLCGLIYQIGNIPLLRDEKIRNNGYLVLGSLGTVVILLGLSFDFFWSELRDDQFWTNDLLKSPEFIAASLLSIAALILFIMHKINQRPFELKPVEPVFILFFIIWMIGLTSPMAIVFVNLLVLGIGVMTIREGAKLHHLGILNYGLLIVTALVICRFFDTDLGFIFKGILFVGVGFGFFFANYQMVRKKKSVSGNIPPTDSIPQN